MKTFSRQTLWPPTDGQSPGRGIETLPRTRNLPQWQALYRLRSVIADAGMMMVPGDISIQAPSAFCPIRNVSLCIRDSQQTGNDKVHRRHNLPKGFGVHVIGQTERVDDVVLLRRDPQSTTFGSRQSNRGG
jgi:hypothetical protein